MSILEEQLRLQAADHGLSEYQPFVEEEDIEERAEDTVREDREQLLNFAGLRESAANFVGTSGQSTLLCPLVQSYATSTDLLQGVGADDLKKELQAIGLKCGGTPKERAERLFQTKGVSDPSTLDKSLFAKRKPSDQPPQSTAKTARLPQKGRSYILCLTNPLCG
eukprot:CAMPEP_0114288688 /NCGR_PEP_ID=MMETSP0059-20121206/6953_1 /TAXON_ID=36894 /ORGANISM="Pyramimonas parkeae, Strain CCMP726" /LENGTH=164 /DNA_ID=CAMNT_0001409869 /DNA_START=220 /DNA_END=714 /DNA_ORIENTATION=-